MVKVYGSHFLIIYFSSLSYVNELSSNLLEIKLTLNKIKS